MRHATFIACAALLAAASVMVDLVTPVVRATEGRKFPSFQYDPSWPQQLPNNWIVGSIGGIAVDAKDHIWVTQRPTSVGQFENSGLTGEGTCCFPAPPVLEFDQAGKLVQAWGP